MFANLPTLTLTGADDQCSLAELSLLSQAKAELAILYQPGLEGTPRFPSAGWRADFLKSTKIKKKAVHICGAKSGRQLLAGELPAEILSGTHRLQLNFNVASFANAHELLAVYHKAYEVTPETMGIILQYHNGTAGPLERLIENMSGADRLRTSILLDSSGGRGILPASWVIPPIAHYLPVGFAGGLSPENIEAVLQQGTKHNRDTWFDMESSLRTNNKFDSVKAMAAVAAFKKATHQRTGHLGA